MFDRAYCNTPLCAPSRADMMTGTLPSELGCYDNGDDFPASMPTFAHHLRAAGYHTALIGRMHFIGPDQHHGFEQRLTTDVYPADLDMVPEWNRPLDQRLQWYHDVDPVITAGPLHATVQQYLDDVEIPDPEFPDPPSPEADPYTPLNDDEWLRPALSSRVPLIITGPSGAQRALREPRIVD